MAAGLAKFVLLQQWHKQSKLSNSGSHLTSKMRDWDTGGKVKLNPKRVGTHKEVWPIINRNLIF
jgi:hypothetical protein